MSRLPKSEFSEEFVDAMRRRMEVSFHKYGPVAKGYPHKVSALQSLLLRVREYEKTGNAENLVDAANYAMIEFMLPSHPSSHFESTDAAGSPGRIWHSGGPATQRPNK